MMGKQERLPQNCETCGTQAGRLFQSYDEGKGFECGQCSLSDPFMSGQQAASIRRYLARVAEAKKNFGKEVTA